MSVLSRVSSAVWTRLGVAAGCLSTATGCGLQFGAGVGLVVGGLFAVGFSLLLVDVDGGAQ